LYNSRQANWALKWGYADWTFLITWGLYLATPFNFMLIPALVQTAFIPRRWVNQKHFTWHAELLPHSE